MNFKQFPALLKETFAEWSSDKCLRLGASLAYYTLSSLIPLLLVVVAVVTFFLSFTGSGQDIQAQLVDRIATAVDNPELAEQISGALIAKSSSDAAAKGTLGAILGFFFLLLAASGVFGELNAAFNIICDVDDAATGKGLWGFISTKFLSFTLVLGVAFLLLVAQVLTLVLSALADRLPLGVLWTIVNLAVQVGLITLVFALLYRFLPDTQVEWGDVWVGGFVAAVLWIVGQQLLALYFKLGSDFSSYGVIGGVLAFLVYVYYSSQILFIGGEFTQVYARRHGSRMSMPATADAPPISKEAALMVTTAATIGQERHREEIAALKTRQYAAAATGGVIGLLGGTLIGGVGLVVGLTRGVAKLRRR